MNEGAAFVNVQVLLQDDGQKHRRGVWVFLRVSSSQPEI
jgi:hypothetical protein